VVLAGFKPVAGRREAAWVGSIPTRLRQQSRESPESTSPRKKDLLKRPGSYSFLVIFTIVQLCFAPNAQLCFATSIVTLPQNRRLSFAQIRQLSLAHSTTTQQESPVAQTTESNPKTWKEFTSKEGFFSILLPGTPVQQVQRVGSQVEPLVYFSYTLQTETHAYYVAYVDFPEVPNDVRGIIKILDGGRDGAVATINGKLISEVDLWLKGVPGRAITVEGAGQLLKARIYLAELRLYLIMIVANKNQSATPEINTLENALVERFLDSFKLSKMKKK